MSVEQITELFQKLTTAATAEERVSVASDVCGVVSKSGTSALVTISAQLKEAIEDVSSPSAREGGLVAFKKLVEKQAEPFLVPLIPCLLERAADKVAPVRTAAEEAATALFAILNPYSTAMILEFLFDGMNQARNWQTKVLALNLLAGLAKTAPNQIAAALSDIVPRLTGESPASPGSMHAATHAQPDR